MSSSNIDKSYSLKWRVNLVKIRGFMLFQVAEMFHVTFPKLWSQVSHSKACGASCNCDAVIPAFCHGYAIGDLWIFRSC